MSTVYFQSVSKYGKILNLGGGSFFNFFVHSFIIKRLGSKRIIWLSNRPVGSETFHVGGGREGR